MLTDILALRKWLEKPAKEDLSKMLKTACMMWFVWVVLLTRKSLTHKGVPNSDWLLPAWTLIKAA